MRGRRSCCRRDRLVHAAWAFPAQHQTFIRRRSLNPAALGFRMTSLLWLRTDRATLYRRENIVHRELSNSELESFPALEWSDIAQRLTPSVRSSIEKVLETQNGADLSHEESYALANSEGDDLLALLVAAN